MEFTKYIYLGKNIHNNYYIFNSRTKHCCLLNQTDYESIIEVQNSKDISKLDEQLQQSLYREGFIVDDFRAEADMVDQMFYEQAYADDVLDITIIMTHDCNFGCLYCYQEAKNGGFETSTEENLLRFIDNETSKCCRKLIVNWFGGEPLLEAERILRMSRRIVETTRKKNISYISRITTNGYLLNKKLFSELLKNHVYIYTITLDATEEQHNRQRPLKNGGDTYQTIISNLQEIKTVTRNYNIDIRCNVSTYNIDDVDVFLNQFKALFQKDKRFNLVFEMVKDWRGEQIHKHLDLLVDENDALRKVYLKAMKIGVNLQNYFSYEACVQICPAIKKRGYTIDWKGYVHKCEMAMHDPVFRDSNCIGIINEKGLLEVNKEREAVWIVRSRDLRKCEVCKAYPYCMGGAQCNFGMKFHGEKHCDEKILFLSIVADQMSTEENIKWIRR